MEHQNGDNSCSPYLFGENVKIVSVASEKGLPEWTQMGSDSGLDPLGMARPSEIIYQSLLPGISTITVRLRYYSFLPWILHTYASNNSNTDPDEFFKFQRNAEALFALIGVYHTYVGGLAGANWASRLLSENDAEIIDFAQSAQQKEGGLLKNRNGALGGIYGPQLQEMDLIASSAEHAIKIPTERGTRMAIAFEATLGPLASIVKAAITEGRISRTNLEKLRILKPSEIDVTSQEGKLLQDILLGDTDSPRPADLARRDSLLRLLKFAKLTKAKPQDYEVRWNWFDSLRVEADLDPWLAYHINDLLVLGYEALLKKSLEVMRSQPDSSIGLLELPPLVFTALNSNKMEERFLRSASLTGNEKGLVDTIIKLGGRTETISDDAVSAAVALVQTILGWANTREQDINKLFPVSSSFQSISTELKFVQSLEKAPIIEVMSEILVQRILKRHLWVASRKFRSQSKYTFLFEPDEGKLRYRNAYEVKLGYPRISQAIQFLEDIKLVDEAEGLSEFGKTVLSAA